MKNGHKPDIVDTIVEMAINGSGVRDASRILKISQNTVIRHLKKLAAAQVSNRQEALDGVQLICEMDEQWGFVGSKRHQHWLCYAFWDT